MVKSLLACTFFLFLFISSQAQTERDIVTQPCEWFALNSNIKLHKQFGLTFDGQVRFSQDFQSAQHYVRIGVEVYLTPKLSVVPFGYTYIWNFQYGKQPSAYKNNEQRIWQQVLYKHTQNRLNFIHRLRMEERFLESHHTESDGSVVNDGYEVYMNRIRYRLLVQIPLNKPKMEAGAWYIAAYDEIFYGWGEGDTFKKIDQNRLYAAFGRQITGKVRLEGGPIYIAVVKKNGAQQENNIGALIQFTYNFDFSNKEN